MEERNLAQTNLIYKIRTGSFMYGTNIPESDNDFLGIFIPDKEYFLGLKRVEQVILSEKVSKGSRNMQGDIDYTCYAVDKFIKLCLACNPNIIEMLFVPSSHVLFMNDYGAALRRIKTTFLNKKAYHTFKGYAYAQRQKLLIKKENMTGRTQLVEQYGYDTKFASHLIRLYLECLELMIECTLTFPLPQNNLVRDIKLGKFTLEEVLKKAEDLERLVDEAYLKTSLPNTPDLDFINEFQIQLLEEYWEEHE